jgi:hypothetical protein
MAVDISRLVGAPRIEIDLQDIGSEIVMTWDCAHRLVGRRNRGRHFSSSRKRCNFRSLVIAHLGRIMRAAAHYRNVNIIPAL